MVNPAEFVTQVKHEFQRVTWPDKSETLGMSVAVVVFMIVFMVYFFTADTVVYHVVHKILGI